MSLEFRYANDDEYPRISAFIDEYWAKNHVYVRAPALFDWTFKRPGFWEPGKYSFALGEDGGELIGILGGVPFDFNVFGKTRRGVWIMNYAVRPDHRKGSAALQLLSTFRNPSFPVVIASGLNPATVAIYKVLRGKVLPEMPRHVVVLPEAADRMHRVISLAKPELETERASALAEAFRLPALGAAEADFGSTLPQNWDSVDWPAIAARTVGAVRDSDYLSWRYLQHPCFEYRMITLKDGDLTGLLIWRLETIRQEAAEGRVDIDRIGRLVEFMPASSENGRKLLGAFLSQVAEQDALGADFYGYHGVTRSILSDNGFRSIDQHPDGAYIPSRFQPIDAGGGILNAMFAEPDIPACTTAGDCPWYWTKSDSDQDRPN